MSLANPVVPTMVGELQLVLKALTISDFETFEQHAFMAAERRAEAALGRLVKFDCSTDINRKAIVDKLEAEIGTSRAEAVFALSYEGLGLLVWLAAHDPSIKLETVKKNLCYRNVNDIRRVIDTLSLPPARLLTAAKKEQDVPNVQAPQGANTADGTSSVASSNTGSE